MQTLKIDAEFKALIPAMSVDEYNGLEQSLLTEGCRDMLVVWDEILIDGHNRYEICQEHGIVFKTVNIDFKDRTEAKIWIIRNQFGRRNLSDYVRAQLALTLKSFFAEKAKEKQREAGGSVRQKSAEPPIETRKELAQIAGVSHDTIAKVERIELRASPELKQAITDKKVSINSAVVISEMPKIEQTEIVQLPKAEIIQKVKAHVSHNSGENEWYTPSEYIEAARKVMGSIDLDPASSELANKTVKANIFYNSDNSGLSEDKAWSGNVWMNPPYAQPLITQFIEKFAYHAGTGEITEGIVLVNNATETKWFGILVSVCSAVVFPNSRIKFISPDDKKVCAPLQGQAILYSGDNPDTFISEFSRFGWWAKIE